MERFDFVNFARVLQIEFTEGRKRLMRTIFYMFIIYSSVFALFQTIGGWHPAINPDFRGSPYAIRTEVNAVCETTFFFSIIIMFFFVLVSANRLYRNERKKRNDITWQTTSASYLERFLSRWGYLLVYSLAGILPFFVADLLHMGYLWVVDLPVIDATGKFLDLLYREHHTWQVTLCFYSVLLAIHAFYLMGGALFRKFHFILTTTLAVVIICLLVVCFNLAGLYRYDNVTIKIGVAIFSLVSILLYAIMSYRLFCLRESGSTGMVQRSSAN